MEQDKVKDYYEGLQRVIKRYTDCWRNREGKVEITISDDKGFVEWNIKGGISERSQRLREDE